MTSKFVCEYVWLDSLNEFRSKTRVINGATDHSDILEWNYDGSSTGQADSSGNTEIKLKPVAVCPDPLRTIKGNSCFIVLCDSIPRQNALRIFDQNKTEEPWFGIEQEYVFEFPGDNAITNADGFHYCGIGMNYKERAIVEEHLDACLRAGLTISGINAEVATRQLEFQIGPATGIDAADQTCIARYLLDRITEKHGAKICYFPKINSAANGSGCHINFSTRATRGPCGLKVIEAMISKLAEKHDKHIEIYGDYNQYRLTGRHETSSYNVFSYGIGTRNTSVRIPNQTKEQGCGYFEDRRPAANVEIYGATAKLFETCCLGLGEFSSK